MRRIFVRLKKKVLDRNDSVVSKFKDIILMISEDISEDQLKQLNLDLGIYLTQNKIQNVKLDDYTYKLDTQDGSIIQDILSKFSNFQEYLKFTKE